MKTYVNRLMAAGLTLLISSIVACGGGGSSSTADSGVSLTQFNALQTQVNTLSSALTKLQGTVGTQGTAITSDEKILSNVALLAHAPGTSAITTLADRSDGVRTLAIIKGGAQAAAIDFGQCPNGGQYIGSSAPDPSGATVDFFKQCTGVTYGVNSTTPLGDGNFPVSQPTFIWFDGPNCTGNVIQFADDGQYNYRTLLGGVAFISPVDGTTEYWVQPTAANTTPGTMTSASIFTSHTCSADVETHVGFQAILNVTDGASGSGVPAEVSPYVL